MSYTIRSARVAYDNIAVGGATGLERTINGQTPTTPGYFERIKSADGDTSPMESSTEPTTVNDAARDRRLTEVAGSVTTLHPRETIINTN